MEPQRRRKRRNWCRMLRRFLVVSGLLQFGNSLPSKFLVFGAEIQCTLGNGGTLKRRMANDGGECGRHADMV